MASRIHKIDRGDNSQGAQNGELYLGPFLCNMNDDLELQESL